MFPKLFLTSVTDGPYTVKHIRDELYIVLGLEARRRRILEPKKLPKWKNGPKNEPKMTKRDKNDPKNEKYGPSNQ
jgi:hypothetical protein